MNKWYLEGCITGRDSVYRIPLDTLPIVVGRHEEVGLSLPSDNVSRMHAEFSIEEGGLSIKDLGSTNGTFVNHLPVSTLTVLNPGDVVKFADIEFRLYLDSVPQPSEPPQNPNATCIISSSDLTNRLPIGARELDELLQNKLVTPVYQPIIATQSEQIVGMELLGRGCHEQLSASPLELFYLADSLARSVDLSELMRDVGVQQWADTDLEHIPLFVNTHPKELKDCYRLSASLEALRHSHPQTQLVLEIHEEAVTNQKLLAALSETLQALDIKLAYDDFGAGQARLLELLDIPPYIVKFDIALIRDLDRATSTRKEMVGLLVELVKKGETLTLAEGVEHAGELSICRELGFDLIQGYVYSKPQNIRHKT